jgi:hypothetical protein
VLQIGRRLCIGIPEHVSIDGEFIAHNLPEMYRAVVESMLGIEQASRLSLHHDRLCSFVIRTNSVDVHHLQESITPAILITARVACVIHRLEASDADLSALELCDDLLHNSQVAGTGAAYGAARHMELRRLLSIVAEG